MEYTVLPNDKNYQTVFQNLFPMIYCKTRPNMTPEKRKEIIEICHSKNIPYVGIMRNPSVFEMQDCSIKCEDCLRYKGNIQK